MFEAGNGTIDLKAIPRLSMQVVGRDRESIRAELTTHTKAAIDKPLGQAEVGIPDTHADRRCCDGDTDAEGERSRRPSILRQSESQDRG